jgi:tagatose 6-phosphate kinase
MILTITINPLIERRMFFDSIEIGKPNRSSKEIYYAGGKGICVSRQLNRLGIKNTAFTFLGGSYGKLLRHTLTEDKIDFTVVSIKAETRIADVIIEEKNKRVTTFFGLNSQITSEESSEFKSKLEKMIQNCSIVVLSGSSSSEATDDIFPYAIELANKHDKISVLDTYGTHHKACIDSAPTIIHNNSEELEKSFGVSLSDEKNKLEILGELYSKNIKMVFITDGANPAYASKFDFHYKIINPSIDVYDATGSGDAFVAGIVYGLENSFAFEDIIKTASALGAVNAGTIKTCEVLPNEIEEYIEQVQVSPIGKKMKIIDDSPKY